MGSAWQGRGRVSDGEKQMKGRQTGGRWSKIGWLAAAAVATVVVNTGRRRVGAGGILLLLVFCRC